MSHITEAPKIAKLLNDNPALAHEIGQYLEPGTVDKLVSNVENFKPDVNIEDYSDDVCEYINDLPTDEKVGFLDCFTEEEIITSLKEDSGGTVAYHVDRLLDILGDTNFIDCLDEMSETESTKLQRLILSDIIATDTLEGYLDGLMKEEPHLKPMVLGTCESILTKAAEECL